MYMLYRIAGNIGGLALNRYCKNIGEFKFGGSVKDRYTYICKYEMLAGFNLVVANKTAKPPNLKNPLQYFLLYGTCTVKLIIKKPSISWYVLVYVFDQY